MRLLKRLVAIREDAYIPLYATTNRIVHSVMFIYLNIWKNEINLHAKYKRGRYFIAFEQGDKTTYSINKVQTWVRRHLLVDAGINPVVRVNKEIHYLTLKINVRTYVFVHVVSEIYAGKWLTVSKYSHGLSRLQHYNCRIYLMLLLET